MTDARIRQKTTQIGRSGIDEADGRDLRWTRPSPPLKSFGDFCGGGRVAGALPPRLAVTLQCDLSIPQ
jgi:hypothetical protein